MKLKINYLIGNNFSTCRPATKYLISTAIASMLNLF